MAFDSEPVEGQERGVGNYGSAGLLASSAGRGWSGLAAELRNHSGVIAKKPGPDTEICVDVHGGASVVTRQRDGITDRTVSERGTIWLSPAGCPDGVIEVSDPLPAMLHIYLPPSQFSPKSLDEGSDPSAVESLRYESSVHAGVDPGGKAGPKPRRHAGARCLRPCNSGRT